MNFLSLLGWSPGDDRELFTREELIAAFTLEGISGGNAVFNPEKLDWFNQQHILRLPVADLATRLEPMLRETGLWTAELGGDRREWYLQASRARQAASQETGSVRRRASPFPAAGRELRSSPPSRNIWPNET